MPKDERRLARDRAHANRANFEIANGGLVSYEHA
ncbi:hypothetical protein Mal52_53840 [Symmachiella dynata]|uniref:Uncharacterized protein n=1 Tax=Symmachiella dynata TaxID=2527995 RepID=A0A517ZWK8_9PLAN|nr:hypothetical protein Mal52_53840 [Symmachiella dynata]